MIRERNQPNENAQRSYCEQFSVSPQAISQHLKVLREANLVVSPGHPAQSRVVGQRVLRGMAKGEAFDPRGRTSEKMQVTENLISILACRRICTSVIEYAEVPLKLEGA